MRTIDTLSVEGKTVLLRAELNVPVQEGRIRDDFRIRGALPTITYLRDKGARIVILAHRGRPGGKRDATLSLRPIAEHLARVLRFPVAFYEDLMDGEGVRQATAELPEGGVLVVENLRFYAGEEAGEEDFAKHVASLGDVYVNDAFGAMHRAHASQVLIPALMPSAAGLLVEKEYKELEGVRDHPDHPLVLIMGGAKVKTKIRILAHFLKKADAICLGGIIANTILAYKGLGVGKSIVAEDLAEVVGDISLSDDALHLPTDVIVSSSPTGEAPSRVSPIEQVEKDEMILDIGPETRARFADAIADAKTVIWNGPLGLVETEEFARGTREVAGALRESKARLVLGGGDLISIVREAGLEDRIDFISTGGGAMVALLAGEELPGLRALM